MCIDFKSSVNLLQQNNSHQLMGESDSSEADFVLRELFNALVKTERTAYYKGNMPFCHCCAFNRFRKLLACNKSALNAH